MPEGRPREDMMSAFVWLDYSERERRKMLDVVDLFREPNTRDELGIGSVSHRHQRGEGAFPPAGVVFQSIDFDQDERFLPTTQSPF